jgi:hypothetical protein
MSQYILCNDVSMSTSGQTARLPAGKLVDSANQNVSAIVAAGGVLVANSPLAAAQAALLTKYKRYRGQGLLLDVAREVQGVPASLVTQGSTAAMSYASNPAYAVFATDALIVLDSSGWVAQGPLVATLPAAPGLLERHRFVEDGWVVGRPPPQINANGNPIAPYSQGAQTSKARAPGNVATLTDLGAAVAWTWNGNVWEPG